MFGSILTDSLRLKKPPGGGHKKRVIVFINRVVIYVLSVYAYIFMFRKTVIYYRLF